MRARSRTFSVATGAPLDAAFQHRVIAAALALLEGMAGPVLEDFEEDAPASAAVDDVPACPVTFAAPEDPSWAGRLRAELAALRPWYALGARRRGRTAVGISGEDLGACAARIAAAFGAAEAGKPPEDLRALKRASDDLKTFYLEALTAQLGIPPSHAERWLWWGTDLGPALRRLASALGGMPELSNFARILVPRAVMARAPADAEAKG